MGGTVTQIGSRAALVWHVSPPSARFEHPLPWAEDPKTGSVQPIHLESSKDHAPQHNDDDNTDEST